MALVSISEASKWASDFLDKEILPTNISYLLQYGKVKKYGENGSTKIDLNDLKNYLGTNEILTSRLSPEEEIILDHRY